MKFFSYICNCVALDTGMCAVTLVKTNECNPNYWIALAR